ncbi:MAG: hypothetical protein U0531_15275 [Dehalococcoidia bacterium]
MTAADRFDLVIRHGICSTTAPLPGVAADVACAVTASSRSARPAAGVVEIDARGMAVAPRLHRCPHP